MSENQNEQRTQKKKGWLNAAVIGVIVFLASVGGMFYLFVDSQTHDLIERNFRLLGLHGSLLSKKLAIQEKVFKNTIRPILEEEYIDVKKLNESTEENISTECRNYQIEPGADLSEPSVKNMYKKLCKSYSSQVSIDLHIPAPSHSHSPAPAPAIETKFSLSHARFSIHSDPQGANSLFRLGYHNANEEAGGIDILFSVDALMKELELGVEQHIFDDLILADENGQVLYQKNASVFQYDSVVSLLLDRDVEPFFPKSKDDKSSKNTECEDKDPVGKRTSNVLMCSLPASRDIEVADLHYKVFAQAVIFPGSTSEHSIREAGKTVKKNMRENEKGSNNETKKENDGETNGSEPSKVSESSHSSKAILIGLIETGKFRNQAFAISPVYLVFFLFLGISLVFTLPFLKLWTMGPQDRLTIVDVLALFLSCLIGVALLTFFLLYSRVSWTEQKQFAEQLETIADNINMTFQAELGAVLEQVQRLSNSKKFKNDLGTLKENPKIKENWSKILNISPEKDRALESPDDKLFTYPFFNQVSWIAEDGQQKIKWSTGSDVTSLVPVSTRPYFQHVQKANELKDPELFLMKYDNDTSGDPVYFWLEPILSMTTGKFIPVLSMSVGNIGEPDPKLPVVSITPDLISLQQALLPPGFGFAVVHSGQNQDFPEGQVLFHSEDKRNLRENFFNATAHNATLQSVIRFGKTEEVKGRYWGEAHTFYTRPLKSTPWALVVFVNNRVLWTPILQALMLSFVLFGVYAFFVIVVFFLGILVFRSVWLGKGIWLWPQPRLARSYRIASMLNLFILVVFGAIQWKAVSDGGWSDSLFTAAAILPIIGIVILVLVVRNNAENTNNKKNDQEHFQNSERSDPQSSDKCDYLYLMMSLLILLSIMPAFGLFKLSYEEGGKEFHRDLQRGYKKGIIERAEKMIEKYRDVEFFVSEKKDNENFIKDIMHTSLVSVSQSSSKESKQPLEKSIWSCAYEATELTKSQIFSEWYAWLKTIFYLHSLSDRIVSSSKDPASLEDIMRFCPDQENDPWLKGNPSLFHVEDLIDLTSLVAKLRDGSDDLSIYIQSQFFTNTRQRLDEYEKSNVVDASLQAAFVKELNKLLQDSSLYDEERFKGVKLKMKAKDLIDEKLLGDEHIAFNRLLLEDAYPDELVKAHLSIKKTHSLSGWLFGIPISGLLIFLCVRWFLFALCSNRRKLILENLRVCSLLVLVVLGFILVWMIIDSPEFISEHLRYTSLWILILFVLFSVLFLLPRFVVRRIFLFDVETPIRWGEDKLSDVFQNTAKLGFPGMLIVGPPGSGKSTAFEKASGHVFHPINLRELAGNSRHIFLTLLLDAIKQPQGTVIMLDHFEYARGIQESDDQKLELLEELLRRDKRVCVISDVHPLDQEYFLQSKDDESSRPTNNDRRFLDRWMQAFQLFVTLPFSGAMKNETPNTTIAARTHLNKFGKLLSGTKNEEGHTDHATHCSKSRWEFHTDRTTEGSKSSEKLHTDHVTDCSESSVESMRSVARTYYQSLWASCTNDEKLTLYHLAVDRFLHSNNPDFRGLYEKGLIEIRPHLQLMNESFRKFVLAVCEKENVSEWEPHGPGSVWSMMHRPLIVGLVVMGVFLVTTQESVKSEFFAFISIIPVALPALAKFFSIFRQNKSPS